MAQERQSPTQLDLRGVKCPVNWARAKIELEGMPIRGRLEVCVNDPRAVDDLPRAAEANGHVLVAVTARAQDWIIELER